MNAARRRVFVILHTVLSDVVLKRRVTLDNAGNGEESAIGVLILQREAKRVTLPNLKLGRNNKTN